MCVCLQKPLIIVYYHLVYWSVYIGGGHMNQFGCTGKACFGLTVGCTGKTYFRLSVGSTTKAHFRLAVDCTGKACFRLAIGFTGSKRLGKIRQQVTALQMICSVLLVECYSVKFQHLRLGLQVWSDVVFTAFFFILFHV